MYTSDQVIAALDRFCRDTGETLEAREQRLGAKSAPIRQALLNAGPRMFNRNIRLVLMQLDIETGSFLPYLDAAAS